jgi:hypothetical protein
MVIPGACPGSGSLASFFVDTPIATTGNVYGVNWLECGPVGGPNNETWAVTAGLLTTITGPSNTTAETTLYSVPLRASTTRLGGIAFHLNGSAYNLSGGPMDITIRMKLGGVLLQTIRWLAVASNGGARAFALDGTLSNAQDFGAPFRSCELKGELGEPVSATDTGTIDTGSISRFSVCYPGTTIGADLYADQIMLITAQLSVAHTNASLSREFAYVTRLAP